MEWLADHFARNPRQRKLKAVVVGIGGAQVKPTLAYEPVQHIEVALALHRAGHPFIVTAMDPRPEAITLAREALGQRRTITEHGIPDGYFPGREHEHWHKMDEYVAQLCGTPLEKRGKVELKIPETVQQSIRLQGPGKSGDVMHKGLAHNNDIVVCTNLSQYFSEKTQPHLARVLFDATRPGGVLIVEQIALNRPFVRALMSHFSRYRHPDVLYTPNEYILIFQKIRKKDSNAPRRSGR